MNQPAVAKEGGAGLSVDRIASARRRFVEQVFDIDRVELVGLPAELAGDGARALLRDHRSNFFDAERPKHIRHPLTRTTAFELHLVPREHAHLVDAKHVDQALLHVVFQQLTRR